MNMSEFFQKQMRDFYEAPPERVWKRLEVYLEHRRKRRKRQSIRFLQIGVAVVLLLLLLLVAVLGWYFVFRSGL